MRVDTHIRSLKNSLTLALSQRERGDTTPAIVGMG